jgi:antitoxin component of MazEF toxin-antitoxin module
MAVAITSLILTPSKYMIKKLTTIGHSLGIILDRPVLDLLNISRDTELIVTTDGDALILRPVRPQDFTSQPLPELRRHSRLSGLSRSVDHEPLTTMPTSAPKETGKEESF